MFDGHSTDSVPILGVSLPSAQGHARPGHAAAAGTRCTTLGNLRMPAVRRVQAVGGTDHVSLGSDAGALRDAATSRAGPQHVSVSAEGARALPVAGAPSEPPAHARRALPASAVRDSVVLGAREGGAREGEGLRAH